MVDCSKFIQRIQPDNELAKSLKHTSKNKITTANSIELSETSASSCISLYYDGIRELLESIAASKGIKVLNHICYIAFIKENFSENLAKDFDNFRRLRNAINYYGEEISVEKAKDIMEDMNQFIIAINKKKIR